MISCNEVSVVQLAVLSEEDVTVPLMTSYEVETIYIFSCWKNLFYMFIISFLRTLNFGVEKKLTSSHI